MKTARKYDTDQNKFRNSKLYVDFPKFNSMNLGQIKQVSQPFDEIFIIKSALIRCADINLKFSEIKRFNNMHWTWNQRIGQLLQKIPRKYSFSICFCICE